MISRRGFIATFLSTGVLFCHPQTLFGSNPLDHLRYIWTSFEVQELLKSFPTRRPDILSRSIQGGVKLHDHSENVCLTLNETASAILSYCDGTHSLGDIVKKITDQYSVAEERCRKDVLLTLLLFKRKGVIHL